ncbi:MAG: HisA/HisF-related TIM barrel protein, partial [Candidatus Margulisbacteria bacterium]|nr:HisA/HisF-related TIM barrel protein [Candidatus Margulisiibacteriota bacterium]
EKFDDSIAVAIDAKGNFAAAEGWMYVSKKDIPTLTREAISLGVKRFIYTEINRDGMLTGPNFDGIRSFAEAAGVAVIASGGVSSKEDIEKLKEIGVEGCIVGKALYEGKLKLEEVV